MNKTHEIRAPTGEPSPTDTPGLESQTRVIAITSGKGGVGKTNITSNLAIALASRGARVCIFDADTSLANVNIVMGLTPRYTIEHLLSGEKDIDDIILDGPRGVKIVPAASGIARCARLEEDQRRRLIQALAELEARFDYLLIDTGAGIGETVLSFVQSAQYVVVVISPEPTSLTDAFALIRVLKRKGFKRPVYVLVNMVLNYANSMEVFRRFEAAAQKYLRARVHYLGYIPRDEAVGKAVASQTPVLLADPASVASRCFMTLADVLGKQLKGGGQPHGFSAYWERQMAETGPAAETETTAPTSAPAPPSSPGPEEAAGRLTSWLAAGETSRETADALLQPVLEAYRKHFHDLPWDPRELPAFLEESGRLGEPEFRDLILALENVFEKRCGHPLRSLESRMIKLLEDIEDDEEMCARLIRHMKSHYGPQVCRELITSPEDLVRLIREETLDKDTLAFLAEGLTALYRERYGALPGGEARAIVDDLHRMVERLNQQESVLENSLLRLSRYVEDSLEEDGRQDAGDHPGTAASPD